MSLSSLFMVLAWILMGLATGYLAERKGRSFPFWFVIGAAFGIFGLLCLFFLPPQQAALRPNRDEIEVEVEEIKPRDERNWFYIDTKGEQKGPVPTDELKQILSRGEITEGSYVWSEGMESWKPFSEIKNL